MTGLVLILKLVYFEQTLFRRENKSHSFSLLWVYVASIFVKPATFKCYSVHFLPVFSYD